MSAAAAAAATPSAAAAVPATTVPATTVPSAAGVRRVAGVRMPVGPPTGREGGPRGAGGGSAAAAPVDGRRTVLGALPAGDHGTPMSRRTASGDSSQDQSFETKATAIPTADRTRNTARRILPVCAPGDGAQEPGRRIGRALVRCGPGELRTVRRCEAGATGHSHHRTASDGASEEAAGIRSYLLVPAGTRWCRSAGTVAAATGSAGGLPSGLEDRRRSPSPPHWLAHRHGPGDVPPGGHPSRGPLEGTAVGRSPPGRSSPRGARVVPGLRRRLGATGQLSAPPQPGVRWGVRPVGRTAARRRAAAPSGRGRRRPARAGRRPVARRPRRPAARHRHCGRRR